LEVPASRYQPKQRVWEFCWTALSAVKHMHMHMHILSICSVPCRCTATYIVARGHVATRPRVCMQNVSMYDPKHASNLMQATSCDKFEPCHWPLVAYIAFLALCVALCAKGWKPHLKPGVNGGSMLRGLSADQTMHVLKGMTASCHGQLAVYPGLSNDRHWDNYRLCIVVKHMACWPIMYVASVPARLPPLCLMARETEVYT